MENKSFYNSIASSYDGMIDFDSALRSRMELLSAFLKEDYKSAADIGCGSGIDSISLSKLGLNVAAFDPSEEMINRAANNTTRYVAENIKFIETSAFQIDPIYFGKLDFVTCLGNTASNIPQGEIEVSIRNIYNLLKPGGTALLQIINYNKLITEDKRILNINTNDKYTIVRFYDFLGDRIIFNILRFENRNSSNYDLFSTEVWKYNETYLTGLLKKAGFSQVEVWGDMKKSPFDKSSSKDIVFYAVK